MDRNPAEYSDLTLGEIGRWLERIDHRLEKISDSYGERIGRLERFKFISVGVAAMAGTTIGSGLGSGIGSIFGGGS